MSHSFTHSGVTFLYNSDLSGDVTIVAGTSEEKELDVPCVAVLAFVAEHIRREKIATLEQASDLEVLGLLP